MVQSAARGAGRGRLIRAAVLVGSIVLIGAGVFLLRSNDLDPKDGSPSSITGSSGPSRVNPNFDDLAHPHVDRQTAAEDDLLLFLSRPGPVQLGRGPHPIRLSAEDWLEDQGRKQVVDLLLKRFLEGRRPAAAHDLLQTIARLYPGLVEAPTGESLILGANWPETRNALTLCRQVLEDGAIGSYMVYQLEAHDSDPGSLLALALLERLRRERLPAKRLRIVRLLRRTPDHELAPLLRHHLAEHLGSESGLLPDLLESRVGTQSQYSSLRSWMNDPQRDRARTMFLRQDIRASEPTVVLAALDRLRWDPTPELDGEVIWVARNARTANVRDAATRSLAAIPTQAAAALVVDRLESSQNLDACVTVLGTWGHGDGSGGWDTWAAPATFDERQKASLEIARGQTEQTRAAQIEQSFARGGPSLADLLLLPTLVARDDLPANWYDASRGAKLVAGLTASDAATRAATTRAIVPWELGNPQVVPHLAVRLANEQHPAVIRALLDAIVLIGGQTGYPPVVEALSRSRAFHGLVALEAYASVFPRLDRESPLVKLAQAASPEQQAMVAYLFGALPASQSTAPFLLEGLESPDEERRFWSCQTLRRQYGQNFEYVAGKKPEQNREAIAAWNREAKTGPSKRN